MAAIDWKNLPEGIIGFDVIPAKPDWADPTHVPLMVADVVFECGNLAECLEDDELLGMEITALDAMPGGKDAVFSAVKEHLYAMAAADGWLEDLYPLDEVQ